jgi:hypothetical protein
MLSSHADGRSDGSARMMTEGWARKKFLTVLLSP